MPNASNLVSDRSLSYEVKIDEFEGPIELLLHLIKKNEVNIYDIPIALITEQYLETVNLMQSLNLSIAGEFLVMAASLILIKSKMLLPAPETEEEGEDPRHHLVVTLLEYQRFKEVSEQLEERELVWRDIYRRNPAQASVSPLDGGLEEGIDVKGDAPEEDEDDHTDFTLYDLLDALKEILVRHPDPIVMQVTTERLTVKEKIQLIMERIEESENVLFEDLFSEGFTRYDIVVTFLGLLEVVRLGLIRILQGAPFGPIRLQKRDDIGRL